VVEVHITTVSAGLLNQLQIEYIAAHVVFHDAAGPVTVTHLFSQNV
jgi:hypothetical protein